MHSEVIVRSETLSTLLSVRAACQNVKQNGRTSFRKHRVDLISQFKRLVFTVDVESSPGLFHLSFSVSLSTLSPNSPLSPRRSLSKRPFRLSLCFVSTFIRPFICMNSNYAERLSAVSAQTRILLPLEDEINARPINSTLPSSSSFQLSPFCLLFFRAFLVQLRLLDTPTPCAPRTLRLCHLRRMILLDYTITADRLCLTFGSS